MQIMNIVQPLPQEVMCIFLQCGQQVVRLAGAKLAELHTHGGEPKLPKKDAHNSKSCVVA